MSKKDISSIKRSLGQYKRRSNDKIQDVKDFLKDYAHLESMEDFHRKELLSSVDAMKAQFERYEICFDENSQYLMDEDDKLEDDKKNYDKLETEFEEIHEAYKNIKKAAYQTFSIQYNLYFQYF